MQHEYSPQLFGQFWARSCSLRIFPRRQPPRPTGRQDGIRARERRGSSSRADTWQPARLNDTYCAGDRIQVGERSRADVALVNQPVLRLDQDTTITFGGMKDERTSIIELVRGALYFFSRLPRNLEIITAFVNAGVEGTEGLVRVEADRASISIFEGRVLASNQRELTLTNGQSAVAEKGQAPVSTVIVRPGMPSNGLLYYPPSLYFRPQDFQAGPGWQGWCEIPLRPTLRAIFRRPLKPSRLCRTL